MTNVTPLGRALIARMPDPARTLADVLAKIEANANVRTIVLVTSGGRAIGLLSVERANGVTTISSSKEHQTAAPALALVKKSARQVGKIASLPQTEKRAA